jgi:hypothetical protein
MGKTNFFPSPSALRQFWPDSCMQELLIRYRIRNLKSILNKTSPRVHMELELGVLGVLKKLVKYVVHSSKRKE